MTRNRAIALVVSLLFLAVATPVVLQVKKAAAQDPAFCTSCHQQMDDPYLAWARSPHSEVTCVKCHPGSLATDLRHAWMAWVLDVEHVINEAEVSQEACLECHVEGDPERWPAIAATAGHRSHPVGALDCVACHGSSLHVSVPPTDSCKDCHAEQVVIAGMTGVHCMDCHGFLVDAPSLEPTADTCRGCHGGDGPGPTPAAHGTQDCLACHAPHQKARDDAPICGECHQQDAGGHAGTEAACADCHAPHTVGSDAGEACADCHERPSHGGHLACAECHANHDAQIQVVCASCHAERPGLHAEAAHQACETCHRPHTLTPPGPDQCLACHGELARDHAQTGCAGCHKFDR